MTAPRARDGDPEAGAWVLENYGSRVRDALADLFHFSGAAGRLVAPGRSAYDQDETRRLAAEAVAHRIGEAVARLSDAFVADHPGVEWRKIKGMRNVIAHDYGRVDYEILWQALAVDVPQLADYVRRILRH